MPLSRLIAAVRAADVDTLTALCGTAGVDFDELCDVEATSGLPHESPVYQTCALFEAARTRDRRVLEVLLGVPNMNVNQAAGTTGSTAFADCCARGDIEMAELLLNDPRVDPSLGDAVVAHPAVYAALTGNVPIITMFGKRNLLTDDLEPVLLSTAHTCGHTEAVDAIKRTYRESRPLSHPSMQRDDRASKVRMVCMQYANPHDAVVDVKDIGAMAVALGTPLTTDELIETRVALNPSGDGRIPVESIVEWWLGDEEDAAQGASGSEGDEAGVMTEQQQETMSLDA